MCKRVLKTTLKKAILVKYAKSKIVSRQVFYSPWVFLSQYGLMCLWISLKGFHCQKGSRWSWLLLIGYQNMLILFLSATHIQLSLWPMPFLDISSDCTVFRNLLLVTRIMCLLASFGQSSLNCKGRNFVWVQVTILRPMDKPKCWIVLLNSTFVVLLGLPNLLDGLNCLGWILL